MPTIAKDSGTSQPVGSQPLAGGQPISPAAADEAAQWLTLLMSDEVTTEDRKQLQQWRDAHPDHERAWQHIEAVTSGFKRLPGGTAYKSLSSLTGLRSPDRRKLLCALFGIGVAGAAGALVPRTQSWRQMAADHSAGVGEQKQLTLADGTRINLNTRSAIDLLFDAERRLVRLVAGEILITTGPEQEQRPFVVHTNEGSIRALGTRFNVLQSDARTDVSVFEGAVEIAPADPRQAPTLVIHAGERSSFTRHIIEPPSAADEQSTAWARGQIIADDMPLGDFLADLGRYRRGILRCDPQVAGLRLSGVFPLNDTDRILDTLPSVLPVRTRTHTRYWTVVEAAR